MKLTNRQKNILSLLNDYNQIKVSDIAKSNKVSMVTTRTDLDYLEKHNYIIKKHGFITKAEIDDVDDRIQLNFTQKHELANLAKKLIKKNDSILIEGGSSNIFLAKALLESQKEDITVMTLNLYIANILKKSKFNVILLGGLIQNKSQSIVGPLTKLCLQNVNFNKAFIGINGFHKSYGFSGIDAMRVELINTILEKDAEHIVVADSSKFNSIYPYKIDAGNKIKTIVTDNRITDEAQKSFAELNIHVLQTKLGDI